MKWLRIFEISWYDWKRIKLIDFVEKESSGWLECTPILQKLRSIRSIPLGAEIEMGKDLGRLVHLSQYDEHLLVDKRLVISQIDVHLLLEPHPYRLARHLVQVDRRHNLLQLGLDDQLGLLPEGEVGAVAEERVRAGRAPALQVVHRVPLVDARAVRPDGWVRVVLCPPVRARVEEKVAGPGHCARLV